MKQRLKIKSTTIRGRIILLSVGFATALALFVASVSYGVFQNFLKNIQIQSAQNALQLLGTEIDSDLDDILNFSNWCGVDASIGDYLNIMNGNSAPLAKYQNLKQLSVDVWTSFSTEFNKVSSRQYMGRAVISTLDGENFIQFQPSPSTSKGHTGRNLRNATFFNTLFDSAQTEWIGLVENPVTALLNPQVIPVLRPIYQTYSQPPIGWVYIEILPELLTDRFKNFQLPPDASLYITFANGVTYRYDSGELVADVLPEDVVSFPFSGQSWQISQKLSNQELMVQNHYYLLIILGIFFVILMLGLGLMLLMNRMIADPVNAIIRKITRVSLGDFSREPAIEWDNEMGQIGKGINDLSENVQALMAKKVQDEKTKQELEYQILQSQINPHFLYNTLNSIKWMATIQGAEGIADMTTALSRLLKNVAKGSESLIPLEAELALLKDYFTIMKYRYGGSVELNYDIQDQKLLSCRVHRFSLQPIVENAIFHGIEPKGGAGHIDIHIYEAGNPAQCLHQQPEDAATETTHDAPVHCLMIEVTDNGIGMTEETSARVLAGEDETKNDFFKHVGIANVNQRIRFTFGNDYGISIESCPGKYTTMRFTLPYLQ